MLLLRGRWPAHGAGIGRFVSATALQSIVVDQDSPDDRLFRLDSVVCALRGGARRHDLS